MREPDGWVEFDAALVPLDWGSATYTVLVVPDELAQAAAEQRTRRVEGTMNGTPVNLGLNRADVAGRPFVYAGRSLQRRLQAVLGDVVACRLRPADPDDVLVPPDVVDLLEGAGLRDPFDALPPARRRQVLARVEAAVSEATRLARLREALADPR